MRALHDVPAPAKLNLFLHVVGKQPEWSPVQVLADLDRGPLAPLRNG